MLNTLETSIQIFDDRKKEAGKKMYRLLQIIVILLCCILVNDCSEDKSNPQEPEETEIIWKTVFLDDFNRENTDYGDLGSNWKVYEHKVICIKNNCACAGGGWDSTALVLCTQDMDYSMLRVTVKVKTSSAITSPTSPTAILYVGTDSSLSKGYYTGINGDFCSGGIKNLVMTGDHCQLWANSTYILEIIADSAGVYYGMRDSTDVSATSLGWAMSDQYYSGKVGFRLGEISPNEIFIDDFRIEIPE